MFVSFHDLGIEYYRINPELPLSEQKPVDAIIHKLMYWIKYPSTCSDQLAVPGEENEKIVAWTKSTRKLHPKLLFIDSLEQLDLFLRRSYSYEIATQAIHNGNLESVLSIPKYAFLPKGESILELLQRESKSSACYFSRSVSANSREASMDDRRSSFTQYRRDYIALFSSLVIWHWHGGPGIQGPQRRHLQSLRHIRRGVLRKALLPPQCGRLQRRNTALIRTRTLSTDTPSIGWRSVLRPFREMDLLLRRTTKLFTTCRQRPSFWPSIWWRDLLSKLKGFLRWIWLESTLLSIHRIHRTSSASTSTCFPPIRVFRMYLLFSVGIF